MLKCDKSYLVRLLRDLVRIPSFTGREMEISERLRSEMKSLGLFVKTFDSGGNRNNVVGSIRGNSSKGNSLMLNGHVDTQAIVSGWTLDPLSGVIRQGKLYGVGSADQKAGVAAMVAGAKAIVDSGEKLKGDLIVAAVVGHMEGGRGTRTLVMNRVLADFGIVTEPSAMKLMVEGGGIVYLDISTKGRAAFTPERDKGINSILKMMKVIDAVERTNFRFSPTKYIKRPYTNVGVIRGGIWPSIVPDSCMIQVDVRTLPGQSQSSVKSDIERSIAKVRRKDPKLVTRVSYNSTIVENPRYSWRVAETNPIVEIVSDTVRNLSGVKPEYAGFQGWVDGGVLNKAGVPTIVYGPGDPDQIYAPDEHVRIDDVWLAANVYANSSLKVCAG